MKTAFTVPAVVALARAVQTQPATTVNARKQGAQEIQRDTITSHRIPLRNKFRRSDQPGATVTVHFWLRHAKREHHRQNASLLEWIRTHEQE